LKRGSCEWVQVETATRIDLLAFAGLFLTKERPDWLPTPAAKAEQGAKMRTLLGHPADVQLTARDAEYRIGDAVAGRVTAVRA
jgi:hypothetical protein